MKKIVYKFFVSSSLLFGFVSCILKPDFPSEPVISYSSLNKKSILDADGQIIEDSIFVEVNFQDGNGDVGLSSADTTGNFAIRKDDGTLNPYYYNYYCTIYRRNKFTGEYERFKLPTYIDPVTGKTEELNIHGRVPPLLENDQGPIEGKLLYKIGGLDPSIFNSKDSIRFEIFIYDRSLNQSNVITTPSIIINE
ncbi:MAG: hypothetical protein SFU27_08030 [Thermonemataceae bacterium]|nr:hypothetical protein [Thermonemataceae bacterium]